MRNWFDFIDVYLSQGGADISSLFPQEDDKNENKITIRKASKEEIENMTFDEYEEV